MVKDLLIHCDVFDVEDSGRYSCRLPGIEQKHMLNSGKWSNNYSLMKSFKRSSSACLSCHEIGSPMTIFALSEVALASLRLVGRPTVLNDDIDHKSFNNVSMNR